MATRAQAINFFTGHAARGVGDILQYPIGNDLSSMVRQYELEYDTTGAIVCALLNAYAEADGAQFTPQAPAEAQPCVSSTPDGGAAANQADPDAVREPDRKAFLRQYLSIGDAARGWMLDLVACHQVSALNADNIGNYFLSLQDTRVRGAPILRVINVAKNAFPKIVEIDELRAILTNVAFIQYHCTYSSSPGLVQRFLEDTAGFVIISDATRDAVAAAMANYWDRDASDAIPNKTKAMARAYLEVVDALPSNWYQGTKARATVAPFLYAKWINAFRRFVAVQSNVETLAATATVDEIRDWAGVEAMTA